MSEVPFPKIKALADELAEELTAEGFEDYIFLGIRKREDGTGDLWSKAEAGTIALGNMLAYLLATLSTTEVISSVLHLMSTHPMVVARFVAPTDKQQPGEKPEGAIEIKTDWLN